MKASRLISALLAVVLAVGLSACNAPEPIKTDLGEFEYEQTFMTQIGDTVPAAGNTLLVIYLTPTEGTTVDLDLAKDYFYNGTKVKLAGETYDFTCLAYEQVDGSYIRYGLVFEVKDNGYADATEQPVVELLLPPLPTATPEPTPSPTPEPAEEPTPSPTVDGETIPLEDEG
jgi:hypothetical protein